MRKLEINKRVENLSYAIRDVVPFAKELEKKGMKIYYFNIGDPNKFDFDTPEYLKESLKKVLEGKVGHYADSEGFQKLLELIAKRESEISGAKLEAKDFVFTQGVSEAINFVLAELIGKKKEILVPSPVYPLYDQLALFYGGTPVFYKTIEENDWQPDIEDVRRKINEKTVAMVLINPNNPTGAVYSEKTLKEFVNLAAEFELPIISDEIYGEMVFGDEKFTPILKLAKDCDVILLNGFSKMYLIPGWRAGYACFYGSEKMEKLKEGMIKQARNRLSACTPIQHALLNVFKEKEHISETNKRLKERAEFAYKKLNSIEGITTRKPKAAFYIFPKVDLGSRWKTDKQFVLDVLENTGLVLVQGSGFSPNINDHFRSVTLPPIEVQEEAFSKLEEFMRKKIIHISAHRQA